MKAILSTATQGFLKSKLTFYLIILCTFSLLGQNVGIGTTKPPIEKLHVNGTVLAERNSDVNSPHLQLNETEYDYSRLKFTNNATFTSFSLDGRPAIDSSEAKFNLYNSDFGNIFTATAAGRFGINTSVPAASFHVDGVSGFDPIRIQNDNATKFRIFSNNAIVLGANWQVPIANVIRVETPNMFIGFDGNHVPEYRLEVDGHVKMSKLVISQLAQDGRVLTSNAAGIGTWQDPQGDADADPTNEIQTISKSFGTVTLSDGGGVFFDEVNDNDSDPTNEIQSLSLSGNSLSLTDGNTVKLSTIADPAVRELVETNRSSTYPQVVLDVDATESFVFNRMSGGSSLVFRNSLKNIDIKTDITSHDITGEENISVGSNLFGSDISGDGNIILGQHTNSEYSGNNNIMIGKYAGDQNANIRFSNIFIGESAGQYANGNSNICIGNNAGNYTGGLSIHIGDGTSGANGINNRSVGIGYNAYTTTSDQVRLGNSTTLTIGGNQAWTTFSDGRFKNNIIENVPGLSFIKKLKPVTYNFDGRKLEKFMRGDKAYEALSLEYKQSFQSRSHTLNTGFIAQDVERAAQSLGYDFDGVVSPKNDQDPYVLAYSQFVVPLVKAVQELDEKNQILEERNQDLEARLTKLENILKTNK